MNYFSTLSYRFYLKKACPFLFLSDSFLYNSEQMIFIEFRKKPILFFHSDSSNSVFFSKLPVNSHDHGDKTCQTTNRIGNRFRDKHTMHAQSK